MESQVPSELNYKKSDVTFPQYQLSLVTQQSGGSGTNSVTLDISGGQQSIFELPASNAFNLSQSFLDYDYTLPAVGGSYNVAFMNTAPAIRQITFQTRTMVKMVDIPNFQYFLNETWPTDTEWKKFITNERKDMICRSNQLSGVVDPANPGVNWGCGVRPTGSTAGTNYVATLNSSNYTEPLYIMTSSAVGTALTVRVRLNLGSIYNTLFALDKDLYFGEVTQIIITWAGYTELGYTSVAVFNTDSATNVDTAALATAFNIDNLKFLLAVEQNANIVNALREKVATSGLSTLMDYVHPTKTNFVAGATTQNLSQKYNRAQGRKLKRIYNAIYSAGAAAHVRYDHRNVIMSAADQSLATTTNNPGAVITDYYTMLDNTRIQQFNINPATYDDWILHKKKFEGSAIQDAGVYGYNWVHVESFDGMKTCEHDNNVSSGLDLSFERKWDFTALTNALAYAVNHYTFAVTEKELLITSAGITCN